MEIIPELVREMALGVGLLQLVKVRLQVYVYFTFSCIDNHGYYLSLGMIPCMDLNDVPTNGYISYSDGTVNSRTAGTVATYSCDTGYLLVGDTTRVCQVDGTWDSTSPICERKPSLLHPIKCISFVHALYDYHQLVFGMSTDVSHSIKR